MGPGSKELPVKVERVIPVVTGPHSALLPYLQYTNTTIILIIIKVKTKSSTVSHESAAGSALLKEGTGYLGLALVVAAVVVFWLAVCFEALAVPLISLVCVGVSTSSCCCVV